MGYKEAHHSFEIRTAGQFLRKLEEDYTAFKAEPLSSRHAINCALTAWHLREWFWAQRLKANAAEQKRLFARGFKGLGEFDAFLRDAYPEFQILQAICNGSKHFQVSGCVERSFTDTHTVYMSRRRSFSGRRSKGPPSLFVLVKDDKGRHLVIFDEVLKRVILFWQSKLQSEDYGWRIRPSSRPIGRGGFGFVPKASTV